MHIDVDKVMAAIAAPSDEKKVEYLRKLVTGMLTLPRVPDTSAPSLNAEAVIHRIEASGFADWNQPLAWIRQDGFVMPTVDYQHEYVLHWLGLESATVEDQGWARLSNSGWQCHYRLGHAQKRALVARGCVVDKDSERLKKAWHGLPPYDDTTPRAYRLPR